MTEYVVLVDDNNTPIGREDKDLVHNANTPLHRAFSLFVFNNKGQLLIQQRSHLKKTFPLVWSNSCCGHPMPGETTLKAVKRRLKDELNIKISDIHCILPNFRYKAEMNGIFENEICPVYIGFTTEIPVINSDEVENYKWVEWNKFIKIVNSDDTSFSVWSKLEIKELLKSPKFRMLFGPAIG